MVEELDDLINKIAALAARALKGHLAVGDEESLSHIRHVLDESAVLLGMACEALHKLKFRDIEVVQSALGSPSSLRVKDSVFCSMEFS